MRQDQSATPILIAMFGNALLTAMDAVVKGMSADFPTSQLVGTRFLAAGLWVGLWLAMTRPGWPRLDRLGAHALRAFIMVTSAMCFFYALGRIPLAELFSITLTSPLFIALFGALFLRERVRWTIAAAIAIGFSGVLVIVGEGLGGGGTAQPLAVAAALLTPVIYAAGIVLLRAQTAHDSPAVIVCIQSLLATLFIAPVIATEFVAPDGAALLRFAVIGLLGASGYLCFTFALSRTAAARFSIVEYTGLLWAALFGYVFFAEVPRLPVWIGATLIISACVLVMRAKSAPPAA